jgi:hypothetical protein
LICVHLVLDLINGEDHSFDVDVLDEAFDHRFQDILGGATSTFSA